MQWYWIVGTVIVALLGAGLTLRRVLMPRASLNDKRCPTCGNFHGRKPS